MGLGLLVWGCNVSLGMVFQNLDQNFYVDYYRFLFSVFVSILFANENVSVWGKILVVFEHFPRNVASKS